jgi:polyisoprenyl-teichoic acid--peptidoglycan teichoic acid transferase
MWKKVAMGAAVVALFILSAALMYALGTYSKISVRPRGNQTSATPTSSPIPDTFNQGRTHTAILLGYGGGGHQGGLLTDTMMVVIIDPPSKTITLLSLPRDLWVQLPLTPEQKSGWKINAAYAIGSDDKGYRYKPVEYTGPAGGGQLAKYAVKEVTGLNVDKFVAVNFSGFRRSVDVLGGVEVNVERSFVDPVYPIEGKETDPCGKSDDELKFYSTQSAAVTEQAFPCRYETLTFEQGLTLMDGETALKYVRSRHSSQDGTDFGRAARQRNLLVSVRDRVFRLDFFSKIIPFINSLADDVKTDYTIGDMQDFLKYKDELGEYRITSTAITEDNVLKIGRSPNGQSIVIAREGIDQWGSVQGWIQQELGRLRNPETATQSGEATASAKPR